MLFDLISILIFKNSGLSQQDFIYAFIFHYLRSQIISTQVMGSISYKYGWQHIKLYIGASCFFAQRTYKSV